MLDYLFLLTVLFNVACLFYFILPLTFALLFMQMLPRSTDTLLKVVIRQRFAPAWSDIGKLRPMIHSTAPDALKI